MVETGFGRGLSRGLVGKAFWVSMMRMQKRRRIEVALEGLGRGVRVCLKLAVVYQDGEPMVFQDAEGRLCSNSNAS